MPVMHVAALHGLSWLTVRRAEERAIERWEATRPAVPLRHVGVDEKWLGRRHKLRAQVRHDRQQPRDRRARLDQPWPHGTGAASLAREFSVIVEFEREVREKKMTAF